MAYLKKIPISTRVFLGFLFLGILVSAASSIASYWGVEHAVRQEIRETLIATASTGSLQIDTQLHEQIKTQADEASPAYKKLQRVLKTIRSANPSICYVYTVRRTNRPHIYKFVVDASDDPINRSHVGETYDGHDAPDMEMGFEYPTADRNIMSDKWGQWISGYAPIRDKSGRTVAMLGVDLSPGELESRRSGLICIALGNLMTALFASVIFSLLCTHGILAIIGRFRGALDRVGKGDLETQLDTRVSDAKEIVELSEGFNAMVSELKTSRERLLEQTTRDFLTGFYNHMYLHERTENEIARAERYHHPLSLLIIDLDRFKSMNDSFGHPVGDSVLRQLSDVMRENLRVTDVPARYGGDEFAIILTETGREAAMEVAERIRTAVEHHPFLAVPIDQLGADEHRETSGKRISLTVTIGLASYPADHYNKDGLIMAADIALCRGKHVSRNSVNAYEKAAGDNGVDPEDLYRMLRNPNVGLLEPLSDEVDAKGKKIRGHSERTVEYALNIGRAIGMQSDSLDLLKIAGLLHDLGQVGESDTIINKAGSLTQEEQDAIRQHPCAGKNIIEHADNLRQVIPAILYHHERYDGQGYPDGLSGDSIPLMARILAIADAFEAMTSDRPYRKAMSVQAALIELRANAGKQFDPSLVESFIDSVVEKSGRKAA